MLNNDALAQLKGLKQQIEAQKEHTEATVKGTQNRYGFAVVDDGREIFIPPDEMLKVLPGDRVRICIRPATSGQGKPNEKANQKAKPNQEGRTVADIEKLIDSPLDRFVGKVVNKGKAVFVVPDIANLSRWLFIPPHARNGAKPGDRVECAILRHPIRDGKPSAKVLSVLGNDATPGVENAYCAARAGIQWTWPEKRVQALADHVAKHSPLNDNDRTDLTHLAFVSIDAARTLDIDDAVYAEVNHDGWALYVAVADPTAYLADFDSIDEELSQRGTSVYFHGDMVPMLPDTITRDLCALAEDQVRPALVCKMTVTEAGEVGDYSFIKATVRSKAKLSYVAVDRYVTGNNDELIAWSNPLEALVQAYKALRSYREANELVMEDRREYRWHLGEDKQIEHIEAGEKMASQHLVEECMIAANRCAAHFLAMADAPGPFVVHRGFKQERLQEAREFLTRHLPELADVPLETLSGYQQVLKALASSSDELPLRAMINRLLARAEFSRTPAEHMGMALQAYTNFTSPLRKYLDFLVHRQIKAVLAGSFDKRITDDQLQETSRAVARSRDASLTAERWLAANYLQKLARSGQQRFTGKVSHITSGGFSVRLDDTGLEGLVDVRKDPEKFSFDKWTASLTSTTRRFQLGQPVEVEFAGSDEAQGWQSQFMVVEGCGLKPPKA